VSNGRGLFKSCPETTEIVAIKNSAITDAIFEKKF
jgi:hypothetical protein